MLHGLRALFTHGILALGLLLAAAFIGVAVTGPSVKAAEQTLIALGIADLVIAVAMLARFVRASAAFASGVGRVLWALLCAAMLAAAVLSVFLISVMSMDR